jgi:hypothetical protein
MTCLDSSFSVIFFRVSGFGFQVSGYGCRVSGVGFRVSGFGLRVTGIGYQVSGVGCRVSGIGYRVSGFGCLVSCLPGGIPRIRDEDGFPDSCLLFSIVNYELHPGTVVPYRNNASS